MQGNEACAEAALQAGVRFFAGYPITPATEIAEIMATRLPLMDGVFLQMEDELASMAAVIGASLGGKKALTASSGPGFTLKQENLGYAAMCEIPCVIVDVQRGGPSTGMPTLPAQMDVMQARWGTHGDHPIVVLCPSTVEEYYRLTIDAVNFAEMLRTPVIILADAVVGHLREKVVLPEAEELKITNRKPVSVSPAEYQPFKAGDDGVPEFVTYGKGYRYHITSNNHDEGGYPATNDHKVADKLIRRLHEKIEKRRKEIIRIEEMQTEDAEVIIFAYGCTARSAASAVEDARDKGMKAGMIKAMTLWPFPFETVQKYGNKVKAFVVPEMNMGQLVGEVERALKDYPAKVTRLNRIDGRMITPEQIIATIKEVI
jgi:Pyruvate:ferredoxin oxidoreductase and related 2-oxoacid:ferredoxin oxidoreductases, alpha subunit